MASAQVVETSVTNNSPSQDSYHPDDLFQSRLFSQARVEFETLVDSSITQHVQDIKLEPQVFYISIHSNMLSASSTARDRLFSETKKFD